MCRQLVPFADFKAILTPFSEVQSLQPLLLLLKEWGVLISEWSQLSSIRSLITITAQSLELSSDHRYSLILESKFLCSQL